MASVAAAVADAPRRRRPPRLGPREPPSRIELAAARAQSSAFTARTFEMWVPMLRWMPLQPMQTKTPRLIDAHALLYSSARPQSAQYPLSPRFSGAKMLRSRFSLRRCSARSALWLEQDSPCSRIAADDAAGAASLTSIGCIGGGARSWARGPRAPQTEPARKKRGALLFLHT
jgi:hypothetical protein